MCGSYCGVLHTLMQRRRASWELMQCLATVTDDVHNICNEPSSLCIQIHVLPRCFLTKTSTIHGDIATANLRLKYRKIGLRSVYLRPKEL